MPFTAKITIAIFGICTITIGMFMAWALINSFIICTIWIFCTSHIAIISMVASANHRASCVVFIGISFYKAAYSALLAGIVFILPFLRFDEFLICPRFITHICGPISCSRCTSFCSLPFELITVVQLIYASSCTWI